MIRPRSKTIILLWIEVIFILSVSIAGANSPHRNVIQRATQTPCGLDCIFVVLDLLEQDPSLVNIGGRLASEQNYNTFEELKTVLDSEDVSIIPVQGGRWLYATKSVVGIGFRKSLDGGIGHFFAFNKEGDKIHVFLPPDKVLTIPREQFLTNRTEGEALLVYANHFHYYRDYSRIILAGITGVQ